MHIMGWTTWGWRAITEADMRTWKHYSGRIFVSIPADMNREEILAAMSAALGGIQEDGRQDATVPDSP